MSHEFEGDYNAPLEEAAEMAQIVLGMAGVEEDSEQDKEYRQQRSLWSHHYHEYIMEATWRYWKACLRKGVKPQKPSMRHSRAQGGPNLAVVRLHTGTPPFCRLATYRIKLVNFVIAPS